MVKLGMETLHILRAFGFAAEQVRAELIRPVSI